MWPRLFARSCAEQQLHRWVKCSNFKPSPKPRYPEQGVILLGRDGHWADPDLRPLAGSSVANGFRLRPAPPLQRCFMIFTYKLLKIFKNPRFQAKFKAGTPPHFWINAGRSDGGAGLKAGRLQHWSCSNTTNIIINTCEYSSLNCSNFLCFQQFSIIFDFLKSFEVPLSVLGIWVSECYNWYY